jgi:hypothetical protein
MASVPQPLTGGHAPALDLSSPAALFVWIMEARETFADLAVVAEDATLPLKRRRLGREEARERFERARAGLAWLLGEDVTAVHEEPAGLLAPRALVGGTR